MRDLTDALGPAGIETARLETLLEETLGVDDITEIASVALLDRGAAPEPAQDLLVIVHPGDYDGDRTAQARAARAILGELRRNPDVVAVRRESCARARMPGLDAALDRACAPQGRARVYYDPSTRDSLARIARDMHRAGQLAGRRRVTLIGAYADPQHGCVTALWQALVAGGLPATAVRLLPACLTSTGVMATPLGTRPALEEGASARASDPAPRAA